MRLQSRALYWIGRIENPNHTYNPGDVQRELEHAKSNLSEVGMPQRH